MNYYYTCNCSLIIKRLRYIGSDRKLLNRFVTLNLRMQWDLVDNLTKTVILTLWVYLIICLLSQLVKDEPLCVNFH